MRYAGTNLGNTFTLTSRNFEISSLLPVYVPVNFASSGNDLFGKSYRKLFFGSLICLSDITISCVHGAYRIEKGILYETLSHNVAYLIGSTIPVVISVTDFNPRLPDSHYEVPLKDGPGYVMKTSDAKKLPKLFKTSSNSLLVTDIGSEVKVGGTMNYMFAKVDIHNPESQWVRVVGYGSTLPTQFMVNFLFKHVVFHFPSSPHFFSFFFSSVISRIFSLKYPNLFTAVLYLGCL